MKTGPFRVPLVLTSPFTANYDEGVAVSVGVGVAVSAGAIGVSVGVGVAVSAGVVGVPVGVPVGVAVDAVLTTIDTNNEAPNGWPSEVETRQ